MLHNYTLEVDNSVAKRFGRLWLILGLAALIISGLFSILLVLSRTPYIQKMIPWVDFFHTALVIHVDMSVFVWFVAFAGVMWSLTSTPRLYKMNLSAVSFCAFGTLAMALTPFVGAGKPLMNNYIPVLQHAAFYFSLAALGLGFLILAVKATLATSWSKPIDARSAQQFGSFTAAVAAVLSVLSFIWSYVLLDGRNLDAHAYFEFLFWGSGHVLQFTHTQLMLVCWLCLASATGLNLKASPRTMFWIFFIGVAPLVVTPYIYMSYEITSGEHNLAFTRLMQYGGGLSAVPISFLLFLALLSQRGEFWRHPLGASLVSSLILFSFGGIISIFIDGVNVVIPAHYHGSIVGVTLAFMGMSYYLLPRLGYREPNARSAMWQAYIYGGGQLLHILGLAWSGGYGVPRKTAGEAQLLERLPEIAGMALMGLGGLIAIIGGLMFLVVAIKAMLPARPAAA